MRARAKTTRHTFKSYITAENFILVPLIAILTGLIAYWAIDLDRDPPLELSNGVPTPSRVVPGGSIKVQWKTERLRTGPCRVTVTREIIDSTRVVWRKERQEIYDTAYSDAESIGGSLMIPFGASWGEAEYKLQACYRCYGLSLTQWVPACTEFGPVQFEIVPPPPDGKPSP